MSLIANNAGARGIAVARALGNWLARPIAVAPTAFRMNSPAGSGSGSALRERWR